MKTWLVWAVAFGSTAAGCTGRMPEGGTDAGHACVDNLLCIRGDHWDSTLCKCVPDAPGGVDAAKACIDNVLCIRGDHWDSTLCKCAPDVPAPPGGQCAAASDCRGILPTLCMVCEGGGDGCAHWTCKAGRCETAYCE
jgi:hypothetical protein